MSWVSHKENTLLTSTPPNPLYSGMKWKDLVDDAIWPEPFALGQVMNFTGDTHNPVNSQNES